MEENQGTIQMGGQGGPLCRGDLSLRPGEWEGNNYGKSQGKGVQREQYVWKVCVRDEFRVTEEWRLAPVIGAEWERLAMSKQVSTWTGLVSMTIGLEFAVRGMGRPVVVQSRALP